MMSTGTKGNQISCLGGLFSKQIFTNKNKKLPVNVFKLKIKHQSFKKYYKTVIWWHYS